MYNGGTFATSYVLGAISTLLFSAMMVRHHVFGRLPGLIGVLTGVTMLVPANAGPVGLTFAMVSLVPTAALLILLVPHCSGSHAKHRPDGATDPCRPPVSELTLAAAVT